MKTDTLLHRLKPDGHKDAAIVTSMRHLINEMQEVADAAHAAIAAVHEPAMPIGHYLEQWREHPEIDLEVFDSGTRTKLFGFRIRGVDVTSLLREDLWEEAEAYCERVLGSESSEAVRRTVARMDRADLRQAA